MARRKKPPDKAHLPVSELAISARLLNAFKNLDYLTLAELAEYSSYEELESARNLGRFTMAELLELLAECGLVLKGTPRKFKRHRLPPLQPCVLNDKHRQMLELRRSGMNCGEIGDMFDMGRQGAWLATCAAARFLALMENSSDPLHEYAKKLVSRRRPGGPLLG